MVEIDPANMKPKKSKVGVSLSLDKDNLDYLKDDIEKNAPEGLSLSQVFDEILESVVTSLKVRREIEKSETLW